MLHIVRISYFTGGYPMHTPGDNKNTCVISHTCVFFHTISRCIVI